jgi:hypothetical protein
VAVSLLTLVGLPAPAAASDQVPFSADTVGVRISATKLPGGLTQLQDSLSGNATHLGSVTSMVTVLVDEQGNFTATGCFVGNENGDSVCWAITAHVDITGCVATATAPYTVTGGTGAFANATGGGTYTDVGDVCGGASRVTFTGTISRPNSG